MGPMTDLQAALPWLIPLVALSLGLTIWALVDLLAADRKVAFGPKWLWVVVILVSTPIGPLIYFFVGRRDG